MCVQCHEEYIKRLANAQQDCQAHIQVKYLNLYPALSHSKHVHENKYTYAYSP